MSEIFSKKFNRYNMFCRHLCVIINCIIKYLVYLILRMWVTIIGFFFPHFLVKFLRNLASEIISFFKYVVQLFIKLPVSFRASDTSTYAQKIIFSRRPKKHWKDYSSFIPHHFFLLLAISLPYPFITLLLISRPWLANVVCF
jgi:hypothetical protein